MIRGSTSPHYSARVAFGSVIASNSAHRVLMRYLNTSTSLHREWLTTFRTKDTVALPHHYDPQTYMLIGSCVDWRIRALLELDPLPTTMPDPPLWHPRQLSRRLLGAHPSYAIYGTAQPSCREPIPEELLRDADTLTQRAIHTLLPTFAAVLPEQRYTQLWVEDLAESGFLGAARPDLICGSMAVEIKAFTRQQSITRVLEQLGHVVLQDRYDLYGIREVAIYLARQGALLRMPVFELFMRTSDLAALRRLREQYRQAARNDEIAWLCECMGYSQPGRHEQSRMIMLFFKFVRREVVVGGDTKHPSKSVVRECTPSRNDVRVAEAALTSHTLEEIFDAILGWRVAMRYGIVELADPTKQRYKPDSPLELSSISQVKIDDILTRDRIPELIHLVQHGPGRHSVRHVVLPAGIGPHTRYSLFVHRLRQQTGVSAAARGYRLAYGESIPRGSSSTGQPSRSTSVWNAKRSVMPAT